MSISFNMEDGNIIINDFSGSSSHVSNVSVIPSFPTLSGHVPTLGSLIQVPNGIGGLLYIGDGQNWVPAGSAAGISVLNAGPGITLTPSPILGPVGTISLTSNVINFSDTLTIGASSSTATLGGAAVSFHVIAGSIGPTELQPTGVTAGQYGPGPAYPNGNVPYFQVDVDGRLEVAGTTAFGGDIIGNVQTVTVTGLQTRSVSNAAPANGNTLIWDSGTSKWTPQNSGPIIITDTTAPLTYYPTFVSTTGTGVKNINIDSASLSYIVGATGNANSLTLGTTIAIGTTTGTASALSTDSISIGRSSGTGTSASSANIMMGAFAGNSTMTGGSNLGIGNSTLGLNTSGFQNVGIGGSSLLQNTTGVANTAVGYNSLSANTTGQLNCAFGASSLKENISGGSNVAVGISNQWDGNFNVTVGISSAGGTIFTAGENVSQTGTTITSDSPVFASFQVGYTIIYNGGANRALITAYTSPTQVSGTPSQTIPLTGSWTILAVANENVTIGQQSMAQCNSSGNVAIGAKSLAGFSVRAVTGGNNVCIGLNSVRTLHDGTENSFTGTNSGLNLLSNCNNNVANGSNVLKSRISVSNCVALGFDSMRGVEFTATLPSTVTMNVSSVSSGSIYIGMVIYENIIGSASKALQIKTTVTSFISGTGGAGIYGVVATTPVSTPTVYYGTIDANAVESVAVGFQSLLAAGIGRQTAVGSRSLTAVTSGANNTGLGYFSGISITTGSDNTMIGNSAGSSLTTGSRNAALGSLCNIGSAISGAVTIGYSYTNTVSNTIVLAPNSTEVFRTLDPATGGFTNKKVKTIDATTTISLTPSIALGGYLEASAAGAITITIDTGANFDANTQLAGGLYTGLSFSCTVASSNVSGIITFAASAGITIKGSLTSLPNSTNTLLFYRTGAATWDVTIESGFFAQIPVTDTNAAATYYPTFVSVTGTGLKTLNIDSAVFRFTVGATPAANCLVLGSTIAIGTTGGVAFATGSAAVSIGVFSSAAGSSSISIGSGASTTLGNGIAVGNGASSTAGNATSIGRSATTSATAALAVGDGATATGLSSLSIGQNANTSLNNGIAIGTGSSATTQNSIAIGTSAAASTSSVTISIGLFSSASGPSSLSIGQNSITTLNNGIAIGTSTITTAANAMSIGRIANASGTTSIAIGDAANASGNTSIAFGAGSNASAQASIVIGNNAGSTASTGLNNIAIGTSSLTANTSGQSNVCVGRSTMSANTTGTQNCAFGVLAMQGNITGSDNAAFGTSSLNNNISGGLNCGYGSSSLLNNISGNNNCAYGGNAVSNNTTGSNNTGVGFNALRNQGVLRYTIGTASQSTTTITGGGGTLWRANMVGGTIVFANLVQAPITAFVSATQLTSTTSQTVANQAYAIYYGPLTNNTGTVSQTTTTVTGVGTAFTSAMVSGWIVYSTGQVAQITAFTNSTTLTVTPSQTVAAGTTFILYFSTISDNSAFGNSALFTNTTAGQLCAFGSNALLNSTATQQCAFGYNSLSSATNGGSNSAFGYISGSSVTSGTDNTILGNSAGTTLTTGSKNSILGSLCNIGPSVNGALVLGYSYTNTVANTAVLAPNGTEVFRTLDPTTGGFTNASLKNSTGTSSFTLTPTFALGGYVEATAAGAIAIAIDTGANFDANAQLAGGLYVGLSFRCTVISSNATGAITFSAGAGITIKGVSARPVNNGDTLLFYRTGAATWDVVIG